MHAGGPRIEAGARTGRRGGWRGLATVAALALWLPFALAASGRGTSVSLAAPLDARPAVLCFYNPETNVQNYASLKLEFDTYFSRHGGFQFQPFSDRRTFEAYLRMHPGSVFLLSSWHFRALPGRTGLEAPLVGQVRGRSTQRKFLVSRQGQGFTAALALGPVASAGSEDFTTNLLKEMASRSREALPASLRILSVPKEIDALMSVGFGMAATALVTETTLERYAALNPRQHAALKRVASGDEMLLPVVVLGREADSGSRRMVAQLARMGETAEGRSLLQMLGLDAFKRPGEAEARMLLP